MESRSDQNNRTRIKHQNVSKKSPAALKPPVVLVPTTPEALDEVPIATEDEASPTLVIQTPPDSYARIAALPAARTNVVVWPRNPTIASPAPATPPLGQGSPKADATGLQRPLPEFIWNGAVLADATQESNTSSSASSLPSSSPIQYTDSATATPAPQPNTTGVQSTPVDISEATPKGLGSYEDFWAHVRTPSFAENNIPSALRTPHTLTPRANGNPPTLPWATVEPANRDRTEANAHDIENRPPSNRIDNSHPPVASRLRKRRRGLSPVSGERTKKAARRKGKAKAKDTTDVFGLSQTNPWASTSETSNPTTGTNEGMQPPASVLAQQFAIPNLTPYEDFARAASASTSFFGRFNQSGSYPTPHRLSESPTPASAASTSAPTPSQLSSLPPSSAPPGSTRRNSFASSRHSMDVDRTPRLDQGRATSTSTAPVPRGRHDNLATGSRQDLEDGWRGLRGESRDAPPGQTSWDERSGAYRSPTVDEASEEGEIQGARHPKRAGSHGRSSDETRRQGIYGRLRTSEAPWHEQESAPPAQSQSTRWSETPFPHDGFSVREDAEDWRGRMPTSNARDEDDLSSRWTPPRRGHHSRVPPSTHSQRSPRPGEQNPRSATQAHANRLNGLDVFDVGEDDNLPDAVRRGGSAAEGNDENPTPIPFEGDPEVHRHDPEAHLRGMSDTWIQEVWADPANTSITLNTFNPRYTRSYGTNRRTASDLRRVISQISGESNFLVIAPDQAPNYRGRGPVEWAITGLTGEGVDRLLRRRVWSFKAITFFPRRRALDNPRWILALEGFLEDNVEIIEAAVRSTFERPQVRQRIVQMIRANPEFTDIPPEEAFRRVMSSLRVSVYTLDNETVVANIFLRSPTQSIRVWRRWIQELRDLSFGSFHTAIAQVRRISSCAGCLGVDHPSHLCPFTRLPNWNGPESAGGTSYSADGRERLGHQQTDRPQGPTESRNQRRHRNQPAHGSENAHAGPSRMRSAYADGEWEDYGRERGRERSRDNGQGRAYEQGHRGPARRGKKDGPGPAKFGRENYRKEGRR
ncbi:hypothetical protein OH76DRAFT_1487903 [Lentinus brumalis]|uniref:Uncharacterized protein n=1 Tax=Lentinus brumalis TaxID=2498619 RepID=A0A371CT26_9APHY|nr:hypothetical protein OH76DRAFT_1487903 [Polyporus brumalis]